MFFRGQDLRVKVPELNNITTTSNPVTDILWLIRNWSRPTPPEITDEADAAFEALWPREDETAALPRESLASTPSSAVAVTSARVNSAKRVEPTDKVHAISGMELRYK